MLLSCGPRQANRPTLPYYVSSDFTPVWNRAAGERHAVDRFSLIDQDGRTVTNATFAGRVYVANLFFTSCPGICPRMSGNLAALQDVFQGDSGVLFLSHSVTPETDSVPVLRRYAEEHGVESGRWHLVTGDRGEIYALARNSYFADAAEDVPENAGDFLHTEKMFLVDGGGHLRGVYNGVLPAEMKRLEADIRTLRREG
jgi:protein SCO1/2